MKKFNHDFQHRKGTEEFNTPAIPCCCGAILFDTKFCHVLAELAHSTMREIGLVYLPLLLWFWYMTVCRYFHNWDVTYTQHLRYSFLAFLEWNNSLTWNSFSQTLDDHDDHHNRDWWPNIFLKISVKQFLNWTSCQFQPRLLRLERVTCLLISWIGVQSVLPISSLSAFKSIIRMYSCFPKSGHGAFIGFYVLRTWPSGQQNK